MLRCGETYAPEAQMPIENKPWPELAVGDAASVRRTVTANDLFVFANASGNLNPLHMPDALHEGAGPEAVAPSMWLAAQISAVVGNVLPGPGTLYLEQRLRFVERARIGDVFDVSVRVAAKSPPDLARLEVTVAREDGALLVEAETEVRVPLQSIRIEDAEVPRILLDRHVHAERLLAACRGLDPMPTAVVAPEAPDALEGALLAADEGLIRPILVGDADAVAACARELGRTLDGVRVEDVRGHRAAAARAVDLVNAGEAAALMKGHLHTDELLAAVLRREGGLRTGRRLSHVFVMDVPGLPSLLLVTDAAINIAPTLEEKVDICQNAIDLAHALGMPQPKVGVLSAVETVNPKIPSTLDAAILSKMAERGQIRGGLVDGPLAMDNAISLDAAKTKGITSLVAGRAEILVVPNLEAGNILAKELAFVAHAEGAGIVLGARVPVMLTSRADSARSRLMSCAVAVLRDAHARTGRSPVAADTAPARAGAA